MPSRYYRSNRFFRLGPLFISQSNRMKPLPSTPGAPAKGRELPLFAPDILSCDSPALSVPALELPAVGRWRRIERRIETLAQGER